MPGVVEDKKRLDRVLALMLVALIKMAEERDEWGIACKLCAMVKGQHASYCEIRHIADTLSE